MNVQKTTLCYIECAASWLMLLRNKKDSDPNAGKWVGVGGKFLDGETADECLIREVREETGWELASRDFRGIVHFVNDRWPDEDMYLYTATATFPDNGDNGDGGQCQNTPPVPACDEGTFAWVPIADVFALNLWEGDRVFLELLAAGAHNVDLTLVYHGDELVDVRNCATIDPAQNATDEGGKMKIVAIEREYGAGGHTVGKAVADRLGVEIYDKDIIRNAAKASGIEADQLAAEEERLGGGTSFINHIIPIAYDVKNVVFEHERDVILDFAKQGPCVLLGRGAGAILRDAGIPAVTVFLHAPVEERLQRAEELLGVADRDALASTVRRIDKERRAYFEYYTDHKWGDVHDYDLCLDFAALGADRCVDIICRVAQE